MTSSTYFWTASRFSLPVNGAASPSAIADDQERTDKTFLQPFDSFAASFSQSSWLGLSVIGRA